MSMRWMRNKNWGFLSFLFLALFITQCGSSDTIIDDDDDDVSDTYDDDDSDTYDDDSDGTSFTISGTVTGLENTLRLSLNDTDTVNITEDGEFTFNSELDLDAAYEVKVSGQSNDQTCLLSTSSGTISANVSITVTCDDKDWTHPEDGEDYISPDLDGPETGENVAEQRHDLDIDELGNVAITWLQNDGGNNNAFVTYRHEGEWEYPSLTEFVNPEGTTASSSKVATNDDGKFVLALVADSNVYISEFDTENDSRFSHESTALDDEDDVVNVTDTAASNAEVAVSNNGEAFVIWTQEGPSGNQEIFYTRYDNDDDTWTHLLDEDEDGYADGLSLLDGISENSADASNIKVVMDNSGNALVAWLEDDAGGDAQVFISTYDAESDTWTLPDNQADFMSVSGSAVTSFEVQMNSNGDVILAWAQPDGDGDSQIFKAEYDAEEEAWDAPADLTDNISPDGSPATNPDVGIDQSGNMIIVWQQENGAGSSQIFMSEYRGSQWTHEYADVDADYEFLLSHHISESRNAEDEESTDYPATNPRVDMNSRSNAIITWIQTTIEGTIQVYYDDYDGEEWDHDNFLTADDIAEDEFAVGRIALNRFISNEETEIEGLDKNAKLPEVAVGSYGDAQIVWTQQVLTDVEEDEYVDHLFTSEFR